MSADPIPDAVTAAAEAGASAALVDHLPRLTLSRGEAASLLGVSTAAVDRMLADDKLERLVAGRITLASALRAAGWPVSPAPVGAPLTVVPAVAS